MRRLFLLTVLCALFLPYAAEAQLPRALKRVIRTNTPGADVTAPVVTITAPVNCGATCTHDNGTTTPLTTVTISMTDAVGVTSCTWVNAANGANGSVTATLPSTSTTGSIASIALVDGANAITVTCVDAALNAGIKTLTVTFATSGGGGAQACSHCFFETSFRTTDTGTTGAGWTADVFQKDGLQGATANCQNMGHPTGFPCNQCNTDDSPFDGPQTGGAGAVSDWGGHNINDATTNYGCGKVTTAANNPDGLGGKAYSHYRGPGAQQNSGGIRIGWDATPKSEIWLRYYTRWESGFAWPSSCPFINKEIYINASQSDFILIDYNGCVFSVQTNCAADGDGCTATHFDTSETFAEINNGAVGDGLYHCVEVHLKSDTGAGDGVIEVWHDAPSGDLNAATARIANYTGVDMGQMTFKYLTQTNNWTTSNSVAMKQDYDDFAVSSTGRIGCF